MNLRERLNALCENPRLVAAGTDLSFAESLKESYEQRGGLSAGRKSWLEKLEVKYNEENYVDPLSTEMGTIIKTLLAYEHLEPRDRGFVESIRNQYVRWNNMSEKQSGALMSVFEKYSPAGQKKQKQWLTEYKKEHKPDALIAANYYKSNPPYFQALITNILDDDDFVPTKRQFNKLVKNRYVAKVIASTNSEPKYKVNDVIEIRATAPHHVAVASMGGQTRGFILKTNSLPVITPAKGGKRYLILPVGSAQPLHIEERYIKKAKIK